MAAIRRLAYLIIYRRFYPGFPPSVNDGLEVDRVAVDGVSGLVDGLRKGRMCVDRLDQLLHRPLESQYGPRLGDQLGRLVSHDVDAEHRVVAGIGDDLDETSRVARDLRAAARQER